MKRKLSYFFKPSSVAVIGASEKPGKVGNSVMRNLINSGYAKKGQIYPINPKSNSILGYKAYKSVLDVEDSIDLAIICIPAKLVVNIVKECAEKKIKGVIIITAGFKEVGGTGLEWEQELYNISKQTGIRILGPNCLGIISPHMNGTFAKTQPKKGHIAMISQSGAMMTAILDWSLEKEIGFSNFVSLGNKVDLNEVDFIEEFATDPDTKIIILYIESIVDGNRFLKVVPKATKKKPVIIIKSGTSEAGSRAASSHTGALAGNDIAFDLAFEKTGVIRVRNMNDLFDLASIFNNTSLPNGKNFAIITNAGGPGIITTDAFEYFKLGLSRFSSSIIEKLRKNLPKEAAIYNPIDIIGDAPPERYRAALEIVFEEPDDICTGAVVLVTPQAQTNPPKVAKILLEIQEKFPNKIIVAVFMGGVSMREPIKILKGTKISCYEFPEPAIKSLKYMTLYSDLQQKLDINLKKVPKYRVSLDRILTIINNAKKDGRTVLYSSESSEIFRIYGIKNPKTLLARSAREAEEFSMQIGFPLVMKIVSPQIIHKSDVGGVMLNIKTPEQARTVYIRIINNAKKYGPANARIIGVELQQMIQTDKYKKKNELIIGISRDPQWGPLIMVGTGGIYANFLKDVAFDLAYKYSKEDALLHLQKTKIYSILKGVRGEPPSDIEAVLDVLVKISQLSHDIPDILELDINPLFVFEDSPEHDNYSAIDIKITIKK
ncbi:MAG: acetate--CoA ligase alpha subunit [Promethearchaeota archaeon]